MANVGTLRIPEITAISGKRTPLTAETEVVQLTIVTQTGAFAIDLDVPKGMQLEQGTVMNTRTIVTKIWRNMGTPALLELLASVIESETVTAD